MIESRDLITAGCSKSQVLYNLLMFSDHVLLDQSDVWWDRNSIPHKQLVLILNPLDYLKSAGIVKVYGRTVGSVTINSNSLLGPWKLGTYPNFLYTYIWVTDQYKYARIKTLNQRTSKVSGFLQATSISVDFAENTLNY